jgi:hypothetical protein
MSTAERSGGLYRKNALRARARGHADETRLELPKNGAALLTYFSSLCAVLAAIGRFGEVERTALAHGTVAGTTMVAVAARGDAPGLRPGLPARVACARGASVPARVTRAVDGLSAVRVELQLDRAPASPCAGASASAVARVRTGTRSVAGLLVDLWSSP